MVLKISVSVLISLCGVAFTHACENPQNTSVLASGLDFISRSNSAVQVQCSTNESQIFCPWTETGSFLDEAKKIFSDFSKSSYSAFTPRVPDRQPSAGTEIKSETAQIAFEVFNDLKSQKILGPPLHGDRFELEITNVGLDNWCYAACLGGNTIQIADGFLKYLQSRLSSIKLRRAVAAIISHEMGHRYVYDLIRDNPNVKPQDKGLYGHMIIDSVAMTISNTPPAEFAKYLEEMESYKSSSSETDFSARRECFNRLR